MSLFSRIFASKRQRTVATITPPNVVVAEFGEILARGPVPGSVADVQSLPYPKEEIKRSIIQILATATDPQLREHLKFAYVSLADWQVGVGPENQGLDVTKIDRVKPIQELLNDIGARGEEMNKWQPIVKAEQETLIADLQKLGYW
jgi:hypothetical protein